MGMAERVRRKGRGAPPQVSHDTPPAVDSTTAATSTEGQISGVVDGQVRQGGGMVSAVGLTPAEGTLAPPTAPQPKWGAREQAGWMYIVPQDEQDRRLWADEWAEYLLEWTAHARLHTVSLMTFLTYSPFTQIQQRMDAFQTIGDRLVERGLAEWRGEEGRVLRVFWRDPDEWSDVIYDWALRTGHRRLDVRSLVIRETTEAFSTLPEDELRTALGRLVERGVAQWIDEDRGTVLLRV